MNFFKKCRQINKTPIAKTDLQIKADNMTERIKKLADLTIVGDMYVDAIPTEYDRCDIFLPEVIKNAKRAKEFILNQKAPDFSPNERLQKALEYAHMYCGVSEDDKLIFKYNSNI